MDNGLAGPTAVSASRRWWSLTAIAAGVLVVGLDLTVLTLALPTLSRDLRASTGDLQWFSDAYSLVLAAATLRPGCSATVSAASGSSWSPWSSSWPARPPVLTRRPRAS